MTSPSDPNFAAQFEAARLSVTPQMLAAMQRRDAMEKEQVRVLGEQIGYGRMMQLAQLLWHEKLHQSGEPVGGEHVVGPCAALTVPCGCSCSCDWCEGAGWITKKVAEVRRQLEG